MDVIVRAPLCLFAGTSNCVHLLAAFPTSDYAKAKRDDAAKKEKKSLSYAYGKKECGVSFP